MLFKLKRKKGYHCIYDITVLYGLNKSRLRLGTHNTTIEFEYMSNEREMLDEHFSLITDILDTNECPTIEFDDSFKLLNKF